MASTSGWEKGAVAVEALSGAVLAAVAKAVAAKVGGQLAGSVAQGVKKRVFGDPAKKALKKALQRAYDRVLAQHRRVLADYDVNPDFLQFEAASELARVLLPGAVPPSADRMAELCVDSLDPQSDEDARWDRMVALRPAFKAFLEALHEEIGHERALDQITGRVDEARTADSAERLVRYLGAAVATEDDEVEYLRWLIDNHQYLRTAGMVRNTMVQVPLQDVFVNLTAAREARPGDRTDAWFKAERRKLQALRDSGELDRLSFEAAIDRLELQSGGEAQPGHRSDIQLGAVLDAVRNSGQMLVLGEPGSGKTTLLRYLALRHATALITGSEPVAPELGVPRFPVYVRIGDFARSAERAGGIRAFLPDYFKGQECPTRALAHLLDRKLAGGECLVLLDGLDEVASADDRQAVMDAVARLVIAVSRQGNRFVVTSRISGYRAAPLHPSFDAIRIQDMDDPTIERFLDAYCPAVERAEAPEKSADAVQRDACSSAAALTEALGQSPGIRRLAANPLLLTTLLLVHRASGRLPHRRIDAYVEVTEALGRTWRRVQGIPEADLPDNRLLTAWLTRLGAWLHENRPEGSATTREILEVLGPLWSKLNGTQWDPGILLTANPLDSNAGHGIQDFLNKTDVHTGLLVERAPGRFGYSHLTCQEYYAGRALAFEGLARDRGAGIRRRLHDPRYDEPILLALGLVGREQPEEINRLVGEAIFGAVTEPSEYEELLGWDFLFALRVLADDIPLDTETVDCLIRQTLDEWFREDSRCRYSRFRAALKDHLSRLGPTRAASRLMAAFDMIALTRASEAPISFCELAAALSTLGPFPTNVTSALVKLATDNDEDLDLRARAIDALAGVGTLTPEVVTALVRLATGLDDPWVRVRAAKALAGARALTPEVVSALVSLAIHAEDLVVQVWAAEVLAGVGKLTSEVVSALVRLATGLDDPWVRVRAAKALAGARALTPEVVSALVRLAARSIDARSRIEEAHALAESGVLTPEVIPVLVGLVIGDNDARTRVQAADLLAGGGVLPPEVVAALVGLVTGTEHLKAVKTLTGDGALALVPGEFEALMRLVSSTDQPDVREQAAHTLAKHGALTTELVESLTNLATDAVEATVRIQAAGLLAENGALPPEVVGSLVEVVTHAVEARARLQAAGLLAQIGALPPKLITVLVGLATGTDDAIVPLRDAADLAEGGASTPRTSSLAREVENEDLWVRVRAAEVLAMGGVLISKVTAMLVGLATSDDPFVRVRAAKTLAKGRALTPEVITALVELAKDRTKSWGNEREWAVDTLRAAEPTPQLRAELISFLATVATACVTWSETRWSRWCAAIPLLIRTFARLWRRRVLIRRLPSSTREGPAGTTPTTRFGRRPKYMLPIGPDTMGNSRQ